LRHISGIAADAELSASRITAFNAASFAIRGVGLSGHHRTRFAGCGEHR
jgi:hypothetical protein